MSNLKYFRSNPPLSSEYLKRLSYLDGQIKALREYKPRAKNKRLVSWLLVDAETIQAKALKRIEM